MEGVELLRQSLGREAVDVMILSAGYGLIPEDRTIVPYEVTFNTMKAYEVAEWAKFLKVKESFEKAITSYGLVFVLLGENYLRSLSLPVETSPDQTLVFLASKTTATHIRGLAAKTFILSLSNAEAKHYHYGLVGLKGFLLKRFAEEVAKQPQFLEKIYRDPEEFERVIDTVPVQLELPIEVKGVQPVGKNRRKGRLNVKSQATETSDELKEKDKEFLTIPDLPPAPNIHLGMQYFIPEWDDKVDPNYDFYNDIPTPERDTYRDDVYAHEIFNVPNYDGILVSKYIIDKSKKKKAKVDEIGIHEYIRFSGEIMGDCGAFGYIKQEAPPYTSEQVLDYYQKGGFNYGVSVDHLIVGPFAEPGVREKRYDLTLKNADDFLQKHRAGGYEFKPMGAAQGWNPETYAKAVTACIEMGYDYIALGGLARTQSQQIIEILKAVHPHLTPNTRLHLFGVARMNAIPVFRHLGITSFDSASPLRRAWLGSGDNYNSLSGKKYAAIRVPPVDGHGVRVMRLLEAGIANRETLKRLEHDALKALRQFDTGNLSLDETLEKVLAYDELVELPRDGKADPKAQAKRRAKHEVMYRKLLEDTPWKTCDCPICKQIQVEVVIFRGNNRNRRRGFHNTYVFYQRFKQIIKKLS
jgi:queuine/archaeosine tRNA-ribosyltransferase